MHRLQFSVVLFTLNILVTLGQDLPQFLSTPNPYSGCAQESREENLGLNLIYLLDESESIDQAQFELVKNFMIYLNNELTITGGLRGRSGLTWFSQDAGIEVPLGVTSDLTSSNEAISEARLHIGGTNTASGLYLAADQLRRDEGGNGSSGKNAVIVFTDGRRNLGEPLKTAAWWLQEVARVFVVAIGDQVDTNELYQIGSPGDVFLFKTFYELDHCVYDAIVKYACQESLSTTTQPTWPPYTTVHNFTELTTLPHNNTEPPHTTEHPGNVTFTSSHPYDNLTTIAHTTEGPSNQCTSADIVFILDNNYDLFPSYRHIRDFLYNVTLAVAQRTGNNVRVGVVSSSSICKVEMRLDSYTDVDTILAKLAFLLSSTTPSRYTDTECGFEAASFDVLPYVNGNRPSAPDSVIYITSASTGDSHTGSNASLIADAFRENGIETFVVQIFETESMDDHRNLVELAGSEDDVFVVDFASDLGEIVDDVANGALLREECEVEHHCTIDRMNLLFLVDGSNSTRDKDFENTKLAMNIFVDAASNYDAFKYGIAVYASSLTSVMPFQSAERNLTQVKNAINAMHRDPTQADQMPDLYQAFVDSKNMFNTDDVSSKNVIVIFTSGQTGNETDEGIVEAHNLEKDGYQIYGTIFNADTTLIRDITESNVMNSFEPYCLFNGNSNPAYHLLTAVLLDNDRCEHGSTTSTSPQITTTNAPLNTSTTQPVTTTIIPVVTSSTAPPVATTMAPVVTTSTAQPVFTTTAQVVTTSTAQPVITTIEPVVTTSTTQPVTTTIVRVVTSSTAQPGTTTIVPVVTTSTAQPVTTTIVPVVTTSTAQPVTTTIVPVVTTTTAQPLTTTMAPVVTTSTAQPVTTTIVPVVTTTTAQPVTTTMAPVVTTSMAQPVFTTIEPVVTTSTTQPVTTTIVRVVTSSTAQPGTTTIVPVVTTSTAQPVTTTIVPVVTTTTAQPLTTTMAPVVTTSTAQPVTTTIVPVVTTTTAQPVTTTMAPVVTTSMAQPVFTTIEPVVTTSTTQPVTTTIVRVVTSSTAQPGTTTIVPVVTTSTAQPVTTTIVPVVTTSTAQPVTTTIVPVVTTTTAQPLTTTMAPVVTTSTAQPVTTTIVPVVTTTTAQPVTTTMAPVVTTSTAQPVTTTMAPVVTTSTAQPVTTTMAPVVTTSTAQPVTTTMAPVVTTSTAQPVTTMAPVVTTSTAQPVTTTMAPVVTTSTAQPVTTTMAPVVTTSTAQPVTTTMAPVVTTSTAQPVTTTMAPVVTTSTAQPVTTTMAPVVTTSTAQPVTTTIVPVVTTTTAQPVTTTMAPVVTTSTAQPVTTTMAPVVTTSIAQPVTTTMAPVVTTSTAQPVTTTMAPVVTTSTAQPVTTTIVPVITTSSGQVATTPTEAPTTTLPNNCSPNPCLNNGTCTNDYDLNNGYFCSCKGYCHGNVCETCGFSICSSGLAFCMNGATCVASTDGQSYTCNCATGYAGTYCTTHTKALI